MGTQDKHFNLRLSEENRRVGQHSSHTRGAKGRGEVFFIIFAFGKRSISLVTVLKRKKGKGWNTSTESYTLADSLENTHLSGKVTINFLFSYNACGRGEG